MNEWSDEILDGFEDALDMVRSADPGNCSFAWPVDKSTHLAVAGGRLYDCIASVTPDAMTLMAGGMLEDYEFTIVCRRADFETPPISGDLIIKNGRLSRILTPSPSDVSPLLVLHCGTPHK